MKLYATAKRLSVNLLRLGVICNDAGAANQILAYLSKKNLDILGYFTGPAVYIQRELLPNISIGADLNEVIRSCDTLITGTGWSSCLEHEARVLAKKHGIFSIAVLDHWVNYEDRFVRNGFQQLPDQLWVFDEQAQSLAEKAFPNIPVVVKTSIYNELMLSKIIPEALEPNSYLYICEPLRCNAKNSTPLEIIQIDAFVKKIEIHARSEGMKIYLRLHPSEFEAKYVGIIEKFGELNLNLQKGPLWEALNRCGNVVGFSSYALYIAHLAGRNIISSACGHEPSETFDIGQIIPVTSI